MVQSRIEVLHVDDDPDVAELTGTFLKRNDDRFVIETVTGAREALDCIGDRPPDCVVSDYNMPGMDGLEFLQTVREDHPELPFILFTGKGSEAVASEAISAGVTDYLQKGSGSERYELLANRIRNAVRARYETQRADRQEELMRLTEFAGDAGGFEIDMETGDVLFTDGARRLTGFNDGKTLSLENVMELHPPDERHEVQQMLTRAVETGEQKSGTWQYHSLDGDQRLAEITVTPNRTNGDSATVRGAIRDITEQRQRQQELETERRLTARALDTMEDLFYVLDADGTLQRWNSQVTEITGYSEAELAGTAAVELFPDDERRTISDAIERTLSGEAETASSEDIAIEAELLTADGRRIPYEFTGARLTDEDGNPTGLVGIGRDLTERKQREQRFRALIKKSTDVISIIDTDGLFQYQSPSVRRILGYSPEETVGDMAWKYIHPDDRERVVERFEECIDSPDETTLTAEYRARHADGSWRWMDAVVHDQTDRRGVEGYVVNSRDVTHHREREETLAELKTQYQTLVENFPDGAAFLFDTDLQYVQAGGDGLTALGLSPDEIEGATPDDVWPEAIAEETVQYYREALAGRSHTFEHEFGGERYRFRTAPVRAGEGAVSHGLAVAQNVTEQAEHRRKLERQRERLEEFAGIVSHDLRSPLTVAEGSLELAQEDCESDHLSRAADAIEWSQALIDDLLTLAREGETVDELEPVALAEIARSSWQTVETEPATLEVDATLVVEADSGRLRQLLENLSRNAVEHGSTSPHSQAREDSVEHGSTSSRSEADDSVEHGGDEVTVHVGESDGGFYVADDGPGIPEAERERIFEAGYSTADEGTGFGLRIVEQVVDAHGWEVTVTESEQGGARFDVTGVGRVER
jgi:PAS domain S-box-containing protein